MFAIIVEEQAHFYDRIVGITETYVRAVIARDVLSARLASENYPENKYVRIQELPSIGDDMYKNAVKFIEDCRY